MPAMCDRGLVSACSSCPSPTDLTRCSHFRIVASLMTDANHDRHAYCNMQITNLTSVLNTIHKFGNMHLANAPSHSLRGDGLLSMGGFDHPDIAP